MSAFTDQDKELIKDLRRMYQLDQLACSKIGVTRDEAAERRDLHVKHKSIDTYDALLTMVERWLEL